MKRVLLALWLVAMPLGAPANTWIDPARLASHDELERQIRGQLAGQLAAVREHRAAAEDARRAIAALREQSAVVEPLLRQRTERQAQIQALENYEGLRQLTVVLPPAIATEEKRRRSDAAIDAAVGAPSRIDPELDPLPRLKEVLARAQRDLPGQRPAFLPAGIAAVDHLAALRQSLGQFNDGVRPAETELTARSAAASAAVARLVRAAAAARTIPVRYYALRFEAQRRFAPPHLAEIKLRAPFSPDGGIFYHAVVEEGAAEDRDLRVARAMLEQLPGLEEQTAGIERAMFAAEAEFRNISDQWQARNADYTLLTNQEYLLNIMLELVDSTIGIAADGGSPAAFVFEAAWRGVEWLSGDFRIKDPTLSDELRAYRQRIAEQLGAAGTGAPLLVQPDQALLGPAEEMERTMKKNLPMAVGLLDGTLDVGVELIKGTLGETFGKFCASCAAGGKLNARVGQLLALSNPFITPELYDAIVEQGPLLRSAEQAAARLASGTGTDAGNLLARNVEREAFGRKFGIGLAVGAGVTIAKDVIKDGVGLTQERARALTEMAVLDIKWFIARARYVAAAEASRMAQRQLVDYQAQIGELYAKLTRFPDRRLRVIADRTFASVGEKIEANLRFNLPVRNVTVSVGRNNSYMSSLNAGPAREFVVPLYGHRLEVGHEPVQVRALGLATGTPFDPTPLTVPLYAGPTVDEPDRSAGLWAAVESGPDASHRIVTAAPALTFADSPSDKPYIPGDWAGFVVRLPGSLPYQNPRLRTDDGEIDLAAGGAAERRLQFELKQNAESGAVRLVLPAEDGPVRLASVNLPVASPTRRSLGAGVTQVDLPSRGQWFEPSLPPLVPGLGRFLFERRDAAHQWISPKVDVWVTGASKPIRSTWDSHLDMPPGSYDVEVYYRPNKSARGQVLQAGKTTLVTTGGQGRLVMSGKHGKVILYAPGTKRELDATWDSSIDVPPGRYDLRIYLPGGETERSGVVITEGRATVVEVGGSR